MLEEKSSYDAVPVTQGGIGYRRVSNVYGSEAWLFVMDMPLLDDADDVGRVLTGFCWGRRRSTIPRRSLTSSR